MSPQVQVKVARAAPIGATAVAIGACSDRLGRVPGLKRTALDRAGFTGAVGSTAVFVDGERARIVLGLGPSDGVGTDQLRRAAAAFAKAAMRHRRAAFEYPEFLDLDVSEGARAVAEGLVLGGYSFDEFRSSDTGSRTLQTVTLAVGEEGRAARAGVTRGLVVADAVCFARDLVSTPGGTLTAPVMADRAAERATAAGLTVEVMDLEAITEAGLGGLLAVNQGSTQPPRMVKLTYEPVAASADMAAAVPTVALVGKGITFDSGGLSLKTGTAMMDMKMDMGGAAAVIAAMCALPALGIGVRVVGFTPLTDNMVNGDAQRPGDVYTARNGTTVEVLNTDAEGRLVLGDALALASEEEPAAIVDLATLTGACLVALGDRIAGLMGNDDDLRSRVADAAARAGERVWPLPLPDDYRARLDSQIADIKNISATPFGGTLTAGLFLADFVGEGIPWAHLDIAGPAWLNEPDGEQPKGATGFGVRTLISLLETWGDDDRAGR